ncbi:hypothetical protein PENNAL_c0033G07961 [Penicillium nalgiovense]|uniref:Uncharacterized protein n=1 Tax=Penicillium nalgiovense TaxID=60175 RepID=A0A1V6Y741_PENNA|nr:hypothetical protein PENNAL_c0033G07961 [Penicillium nalgiovense]
MSVQSRASYDWHARIYDVRKGQTTVDVLAHPVMSMHEWVSAHDELRAAYIVHAARHFANLARYGPGSQPALGEPCATGRRLKFGTDAI